MVSDSSEVSGRRDTEPTEGATDDALEDDPAGYSRRGSDQRTRPKRTETIEVLLVGPTKGSGSAGGSTEKSSGGGIENFLREQRLRIGETVDVSTHVSRNQPVTLGRIGFLRGLLSGIFAFLRFTLRSKPDVVHVHSSQRYSFYRASLYVWFGRYVWGVPVVLHVHGSAFDAFVESNSQVVRAWQRGVFGACAEILVLSAYWKEVVGKRADEGKIRVLPNAVDPAAFPADPTADPPHIVFVSNLKERKGVIELVEAIERLYDRRKGEFRVSVAGDGPLAEEVAELASDYEAVEYYGYVSEDRKRSLLGEGSIYVLPTYAEGLPIAMLEGMAAANAVVATRVGAIPEVIDEDEGILVEPGDIEGLVAALEALVEDGERRRAMARANRRAVEDHYSWDRVRAILLRVYRTCT